MDPGFEGLANRINEVESEITSEPDDAEPHRRVSPVVDKQDIPNRKTP